MQPLMEPARSPGSTSVDDLVLEARLTHAEAGRRVVEASAWLQGRCLGRCLGEADDAETAEDRALERLRRSLGPRTQAASRAAPEPDGANSSLRRPAAPPIRPAGDPPQARPTEAPAATGSQAPTVQAASAIPPADSAVTNGLEPPADPEDWSEELAELDVQLQRLGWDRNQEGRYLERAFGHPSRSRLTAYADLLAYLKALRSLEGGSQADQAAIPLRRRDLLSQSDQLIASLGWDASQGRSMLEQHFQLSSRQQLSDGQLLAFNVLLENELIKRETTAVSQPRPTG